MPKYIPPKATFSKSIENKRNTKTFEHFLAISKFHFLFHCISNFHNSYVVYFWYLIYFVYFVYIYILVVNWFQVFLFLSIFCQYTRAERRGFGAEAPKPRHRIAALQRQALVASRRSLRAVALCAWLNQIMSSNRIGWIYCVGATAPPRRSPGAHCVRDLHV